MKELKYIEHYSPQTKSQVKKLIEHNTLGSYLHSKYPKAHTIRSDKELFGYLTQLKNQYMKKSSPLTKTLYDSKISAIHNALGTHHFVSRVQGTKLKAKNEIRIASLFKNAPEEFLEMISVHELAHFKEKEHNKAFYKLCTYMQASYHQVEFDVRLYLIHLELFGKIKEWEEKLF